MSTQMKMRDFFNSWIELKENKDVVKKLSGIVGARIGKSLEAKDVQKIYNLNSKLKRMWSDCNRKRDRFECKFCDWLNTDLPIHGVNLSDVCIFLN